MDRSNKQRIVGTVVLLALSLIFLPIIFDGQGSYQVQLSSRIPDRPIIAILPEPTQIRPVIEADSLTDEAEIDLLAENREQESQLEEDSEVTTSESTASSELPQLEASGLPLGWSVRLGSFAQQENASNLMEQLRESGYKAYTRRIATVQGALTSVFVGPWLDRNLVDEYKAELEGEFRLVGDIVRFEIEQL